MTQYNILNVKLYSQLNKLKLVTKTIMNNAKSIIKYDRSLVVWVKFFWLMILGKYEISWKSGN